jgi:metal-dependent amidase/aminoacylase/carboxypeptidase family protein
LFFFVGIAAPDTPPLKAAPNHSPRFRIDEAGLIVGLTSMLHVTFDYLGAAGK